MGWLERLGTGLQLTVVGMGLVFLLLALLWLLLTVLLRLDRAPAAPAPAPAAPAGSPAPAATAPPVVPAPLLTAVGMAVLVHRAVRRKQAAPFMRSHWPGSLLYASRWVAAGRHLQNRAWHPKPR